MNLKTFALILATVMGLGGNAEARVVSCEGVFDPAIKSVLETLNQENNNGLFQDKTVNEFMADFSWNRKRKIRKIVNQIEISNIPSERQLNRYVLELGELLFGRTDVVNSWIFKNQDQRLQSSAELIAKRQLILEGLKTTYSDIHDPTSVSKMAKVLNKLRNLQENRAFQALQFPIRLPSLKGQKISDDLMYKIIRDGFAAHAEEARIQLKHQNKIEAYNTFERLYSPIFLGTVFVIFYQITSDEIKEKTSSQVHATIRELKEQRAQWQTELPKTKTEILEEAYQEAKRDFELKWNDSPTEAEEKKIRADISNELFRKRD